MAEKIPELSIILPAYKEKENLAIFIPQIEAEFQGTPFEIIVVDDNSKDGTRELIAELDKKYHNVVLIERPGLMGIGSALRDGYNKARGEYILSSDADLSFITKDMSALYDKIRTGFDMVLGYRIRSAPTNEEKHEKKLSKHALKAWMEDSITSPLSNWTIRMMSGVRLRNYNTNFRIIRSSMWRKFLTVEDRQFFLFEAIFRAKQSGARITEIPVTFSTRKFGESKVSFLKQAPKYFLKLVRYTVFGK